MGSTTVAGYIALEYTYTGMHTDHTEAAKLFQSPDYHGVNMGLSENGVYPQL